jgi:hypothetical protein
MFVNIPSRIVEIQQYFVAIYLYFLNLFSHLVCACFKYEFMYLDVILKALCNEFFDGEIFALRYSVLCTGSKDANRFPKLQVALFL